MISKEAACKIIENLVARFHEQIASYKKTTTTAAMIRAAYYL